MTPNMQYVEEYILNQKGVCENVRNDAFYRKPIFLHTRIFKLKYENDLCHSKANQSPCQFYNILTF